MSKLSPFAVLIKMRRVSRELSRIWLESSHQYNRCKSLGRTHLGASVRTGATRSKRKAVRFCFSWNFVCSPGRNLPLTVGIWRSSESWSMQFFAPANEIRLQDPAGHPAQYLACRYPSEMRMENALGRVMQISSDLTARTVHCNFLIKFPVARDQARNCGSFPIRFSYREEENDILLPSLLTTVQTYCWFDVTEQNIKIKKSLREI